MGIFARPSPESACGRPLRDWDPRYQEWHPLMGVPFLVPVTGLEPVRGCPQGLLSPWCLPVHHTGRCLYNVSRTGGGVKCAGKKDGGSASFSRPFGMLLYSTVTRPSSETVTVMPVSTAARNSSPRLSTTGILASVHTSARMAPEAARESMGLEKSMQAGCLL